MHTHQAQPRPAQGPAAQAKSVVASGGAGAFVAALLFFFGDVEPEKATAAGVVLAPVLAGVGTFARDEVHRSQPSGFGGLLLRILGRVF